MPLKMIDLPKSRFRNNNRAFNFCPLTEDKVFMARETGDELELDIFDEIGYFGIDTAQVSNMINKKKYKTIKVNINSPGGDVFDGIGIFNELLRHEATVKVNIVGIAASAASIIAMAGDEITIQENAIFMIHNAWTLAIGNKEDLANTIKVLEKIDASIAKTYVAKTDITMEEVVQMMDDESWLDADESLEKGFVHKIEKIENSTNNMLFDLSCYENVPAELKRNIESSLRDAGYTQSQAKRAISQGFAALGQREVDRVNVPEENGSSQEIKQLLESIQKTIKTLN